MFWLTDLILSSEGRKLHTAGQAGPTALVQVVQTWLHAFCCQAPDLTPAWGWDT